VRRFLYNKPVAQIFAAGAILKFKALAILLDLNKKNERQALKLALSGIDC